MDNIDVSVLEYLGKFEPGILVLISITINGKYYESTFYYDAENIVLTASEELESFTGPIQNWKHYQTLIKKTLSKVVPFQEMYNRLDPLDLTKWVYGVIEVDEDDKEIIDGSTIEPLPGTE